MFATFVVNFASKIESIRNLDTSSYFEPFSVVNFVLKIGQLEN
jgi:hypothetical protein